MEHRAYPHGLPQKPSPLVERRQFELALADALDKALTHRSKEAPDLFATPADKSIGARLFELLCISDPVQRGFVDAEKIIDAARETIRSTSEPTRFAAETARLAQFRKKIARGRRACAN